MQISPACILNTPKEVKELLHVITDCMTPKALSQLVYRADHDLTKVDRIGRKSFLS